MPAGTAALRRSTGQRRSQGSSTRERAQTSFSMASQCRSIGPGSKVWPTEIDHVPSGSMARDAAVSIQHRAVIQHAVGAAHHAGVGQIRCCMIPPLGRLCRLQPARLTPAAAPTFSWRRRHAPRHREKCPAGGGAARARGSSAITTRRLSASSDAVGSSAARWDGAR